MGLFAALPLLALPCAAVPAAAVAPPVLVTLDPNFTRGVPLLGFGNELAWQRANDSALAAAVAAAGSAVARYPGGTPSNFWDWRSGCSCTCPLGGCWDPANERAPPPVWARYLNASNWTAPGADISSFTLPLHAATVFDLNVVQGNASWQVAGLRSFRGQGVPIELVELGNELWDPVQNQKRWADGAGYLAAMQPYLSALAAAFPRARLALVGMGAGGAANTAWNRAALGAPGSRGAHAATVHFYTPLDIGSRPVEPSQAAGILATAFEVAAQQQAHADATIPAPMRIWVTEFGHRASSTSWALPSLDGTWLEGLYGGATLLLLLRMERVDVALPYCLACADPNASAFTRGPHGLPPPISEPGSDWRLTARGHVFREIFTIARTAEYQGRGVTAAPVTMREMKFAPDVPLVVGGRVNTSSLVGWAFVHNESGPSAATAAVMIHLGNTSTTLDIT
eukprot:SAG22_NODE_3989_length_1435_cov_1.615269_1_plen_453_part_01